MTADIMVVMANPLPKTGEVFFDARGDERALRLSWHPDADVVVLSLWNRGTCAATFRLPASDVPGFVEALAQSVPQTPRGRRHAAPEPEPLVASTIADPGEFPLTGQYRQPSG